MAIEKPMTPMIRDEDDIEPTEIKIEIENPDAVSVETEDGGMVIDFTGEQAVTLSGRNKSEYIYNSKNNGATLDRRLKWQ